MCEISYNYNNFKIFIVYTYRLYKKMYAYE